MTQGFKKIGNYRLMRLIGQGASSKVYEGRKEGNPQKLAIKMISIKALPIDRRQYIAKEVAIIKSITHPNIVKLYDTVETNNNYYLIFQYCEKGDLQSYLRDHYGVLIPQGPLQKIFYCIADAVAFIHSRGIVHRDLKLANILLKKDSTIKLADFGFAKENSQDMMMKSFIGSECMQPRYPGDQAGTPITMAPEILQRRPYDSKCDIWSLGVILFQLSFGTLPFSIADGYMSFIEKVASEPLCIPSRDKCNPSLASLLDNLLEKRPEKRYSMEDVMHHQWVTMGQVPLFKPVQEVYRLEAVEKSVLIEEYTEEEIGLANAITVFMAKQIENILASHLKRRQSLIKSINGEPSLLLLLHYYDELFLRHLSKASLKFGEQLIPISQLHTQIKIPPPIVEKPLPVKAGVVLIDYLKSLSLTEEPFQKIRVRYEIVLNILQIMRSFDFQITVLQFSVKNPTLSHKRVFKALKNKIQNSKIKPDCLTLILQCRERHSRLKQIRQSLRLSCMNRINTLPSLIKS